MFKMKVTDLRKKSEVFKKGLDKSVLAISSDKETIKNNADLFEEVEDFMSE